MIEVNNQTCTGCSMCVPACPEGAISCLGVSVVQENYCNECNQCIEFCPNGALIRNPFLMVDHDA